MTEYNWLCWSINFELIWQHTLEKPYESGGGQTQSIMFGLSLTITWNPTTMIKHESISEQIFYKLEFLLDDLSEQQVNYKSDCIRNLKAQLDGQLSMDIWLKTRDPLLQALEEQTQ